MSRPQWNGVLDGFFRIPWHFYFEDEITRLSTILLEHGFQEWSKAPRLYIVLRGIGRQHLISAFIKNGIDDDRLPLDSLTLELTIPSLDVAIIEEFVDYQKKVVKHDTSVYDACIRTYHAPERDLVKHPLDDVDFHQISRLLLFCGEKEAACTPKLYHVLRSICHLDKLPLFHAADYDDMWFPFLRSHITLPNFFDSVLAIQSFMQNQVHVCSSRWSEDVHLNFLNEEHNHLKPIKRLGSGGSGTVDHVWCPSFRKNYARKIVVRSFEGFRILANEIKMLKAVSHQHCVSLTGSYTDTRVVALLSEPVADMNLSTFLDTNPLSQDRKQLLQTSFGCLSSALTYLHKKGIWHKDIKPQNILIHGNNILLTDFGLSADSINTATTLVGGTPRYSAPEVEDGARRNASSDIWSMGCVFFEVIAAILGFTMSEIKTYFRGHGRKRLHFKDNLEAARLWISEYCSTEVLMPLSKMTSIASSLTLQMLSFEPVSRPQSTALMAKLADGAQSTSDIYGRCCREELVRAAIDAAPVVHLGSQENLTPDSETVRDFQDWEFSSFDRTISPDLTTATATEKVIKCLCLSLDTSDITQCIKCRTFQHKGCYLHDDGLFGDPKAHLCVECKLATSTNTRGGDLSDPFGNNFGDKSQTKAYERKIVQEESNKRKLELENDPLDNLFSDESPAKISERTDVPSEVNKRDPELEIDQIDLDNLFNDESPAGSDPRVPQNYSGLELEKFQADLAKQIEEFKAGNIALLEGLTVNGNGDVLDEDGDLVAKLTFGNPGALAGKSLNDKGEILDQNHVVIGRINLVPRAPQEEMLDEENQEVTEDYLSDSTSTIWSDRSSITKIPERKRKNEESHNESAIDEASEKLANAIQRYKTRRLRLSQRTVNENN